MKKRKKMRMRWEGGRRLARHCRYLAADLQLESSIQDIRLALALKIKLDYPQDKEEALVPSTPGPLKSVETVYQVNS